MWDEPARPSRPAAAPPPGGYSAAGRQASALLREVHDHLRQELTSLRDLIAQVLRGAQSAQNARSAISQMTLRSNAWTMGAYCQSYCRVVTMHHTGEDLSVFPHLRASDATLSPVLDRLSEEHQAIHGVLDEIDQALVAFIASPRAGQPLQDKADLLTDALLSHLAYEERELLEPLARHGMN